MFLSRFRSHFACHGSNSVRAATITPTLAAPASMSARAASATVEPVV